ncbi:hypothetical protein N9Q87_00025 [Porticoccaceae bacterium]|nr:hypothetical protein [Porticoccaceae bacterium]
MHKNLYILILFACGGGGSSSLHQMHCLEGAGHVSTHGHEHPANDIVDD